MRKTEGITAYWVHEDSDKPVEHAQPYVQAGKLWMPLYGPEKPENFKGYKMPSGDLEKMIV